MDPPRRYFFVHLLKCAGTDLYTRLGGAPEVDLGPERDFSEAELYPNASDRAAVATPQMSVRQLLERWQVRRDEIRLIMGHFPLCTVDLLDADFATFTVLRDPVERTLSHLRHHRRMIAEDRHRPLEEIYDDPFRFERLIHNHMVKMFALTASDMTGGLLTDIALDRAHLERAKARLQTVDVVGLQDRFEDFCVELEQTFGWHLGETFFANRTEPVEVTDSFRRRIVEDNALDQELFEFARELVAARTGSEADRAQRVGRPADGGGEVGV